MDRIKLKIKELTYLKNSMKNSDCKELIQSRIDNLKYKYTIDCQVRQELDEIENRYNL